MYILCTICICRPIYIVYIHTVNTIYCLCKYIQARLVLWSLFEGEDAEEEFERIKTSVADEKVCIMFIVKMLIVTGLYHIIYNYIKIRKNTATHVYN